MRKESDKLKHIIVMIYDTKEEYEKHKKNMIKQNNYNIDKQQVLLDGSIRVVYSHEINSNFKI